MLRHRLVLSFDALADGVTAEAVVAAVVAGIEPPRVAPSQLDAGRAWPPAAMRTPHEPRARLRRLELTVTRRLDGLLHGQHHGLLPGPGSEIAGSREYRAG